MTDKKIFLVSTKNIEDYIKVQNFDVNSNDINCVELTSELEEKILDSAKLNVRLGKGMSSKEYDVLEATVKFVFQKLKESVKNV